MIKPEPGFNQNLKPWVKPEPVIPKQVKTYPEPAYYQLQLFQTQCKSLIHVSLFLVEITVWLISFGLKTEKLHLLAKKC